MFRNAIILLIYHRHKLSGLNSSVIRRCCLLKDVCSIYSRRNHRYTTIDSIH
jgi:hypothetical protein